MREAERTAARHCGSGGPPQPWDAGRRREIDARLTAHYAAILEARERATDQIAGEVDVLLMHAARHRAEVEYSLDHWATPAEQHRVEDRLRRLMEISRLVRGYVAT